MNGRSAPLTVPSNRLVVPDEIGDEAVLWKFVDPGGCPDLNDLAAVHHRDTGRKRHGLVLIMRDKNEGDAH